MKRGLVDIGGRAVALIDVGEVAVGEIAGVMSIGVEVADEATLNGGEGVGVDGGEDEMFNGDGDGS